MAICPGCGKEVRDDIWVCGHCGALMAAAGPTDRPQSAPVGGPATGAFAASGPAYTAAASGTSMPGTTYGGSDALHGTAAGSGFDPIGAGYGTAPTTAGAYGPLGGATSDGSPTGYGAQPLPGPVSNKPSAPSRERGTSRAVLIAALVGFVAVVAIVAVWFFVLRGGAGGDLSPYVGQWQLTVPGSTMTQSFVITDADGEPQLTLSVAQTGQMTGGPQMAGPYQLEFDGDRVYTTFEPTDDASEEQKMAADMIKSAFGAMVDDFKMVFATGTTPDTITLSIEGDLKGGAGSFASLGGQTVELTRISGSL